MDKDGLYTGLRLQSRNMIRAIRNKKINLIKLMRLKEDKHFKDFVMCMVIIKQKNLPEKYLSLERKYESHVWRH